MTSYLRAHGNWASRPADERFSRLENLLWAARHQRGRARRAVVNLEDLSVESNKAGDLELVGESARARMNNWSFKQICNQVNAPANYVSSLVPALAADCLSFGLSRSGKQPNRELLLEERAKQKYNLRAIRSDRYSPIWNDEVVERLIILEKEHGWKVPPARPAFIDQPGVHPATKEDILQMRGSSLSVRVGDLIAPSGLYLGERDLFAFMVNEENRISDGTDEGLARGFFIENSEVGASSFKIMLFFYRHVCGNHIIGGMKEIAEVRVRHVGSAEEKAFDQLVVELKNYADSSAKKIEDKIKQAKKFMLGKGSDEVVDFLFSKLANVPRNVLESAYSKAVEVADNKEEKFDPNTAWGIIQGLTRYSQELPYANRRTRIDSTAGRVLELVA